MSYLKIINTSQGYILTYENLKRKLYNCNTNIYFNAVTQWKVVLDCTIIYILLIIEHNGDVSPENTFPFLTFFFQTY